MRKNDKEKEITHMDEDQIFGNNDQVARINIEERNKDLEGENESERTRSIIRESDKIREKLNEKKNQVRDYGADSREVPM